MKALKLLFFICTASVFAQVPANDECVNAEPIIVSTSLITITPDFNEATESLEATCNSGSVNNKDLWYEFTMPIDGILRISNTSVVNYFAIYDSCGGVEIKCSNDNSSFNNLIIGNTYLLRASYQFDNGGSFAIQALIPVANDECIDREIISISTSSFTQPNLDSSFASESLIASCDSSNNTYLDVWYEFIMPVNGSLEVTSADNKQSFTLYDSCAGSELQCFSGIGLFQNLNQNSTYILRVAERSSDAGVMNFRLQAYAFATNDECVNSETIQVETANMNTYQVDLRTATESIDATCETASNTNHDLWYNFIMPVTGNLKIDQLTGLDIATIYDSCGGAEVSCQSGLQIVSGLVENTNYTIRIASITPRNKQPRFQAFPIAVNDECDNSETLSVTTEDFSQYTVDSRTATESLDSSCDMPSDTNLDLWFDIVMPVTGNLQISGSTFRLKTTLYDTCSGIEIDCFRGNGTYSNLTLNTTYKLRVSQILGDAASRTFRLQAFENIFNDNCTTPQNIVVPINDFTTFSTNNAAATNSLITACEPSNESLTIQDVWFSFTMPNDNDIEIETLSSNVNGYYALYDSCGTTELQCFVNDGFFNNLIQGNDYLLKVGNLSSQSGVLSFGISAKLPVLSNESFTQEAIKIYPNPVETMLHVSSENNIKIENLSIYDITGRLVKQILNSDFENEIDVDMTDLMRGNYFMILESKNKQLMQRIVKK